MLPAWAVTAAAVGAAALAAAAIGLAAASRAIEASAGGACSDWSDVDVCEGPSGGGSGDRVSESGNNTDASSPSTPHCAEPAKALLRSARGSVELQDRHINHEEVTFKSLCRNGERWRVQLGVPLGHCGGRQQLLDGWEVVIHEPAIRVLLEPPLLRRPALFELYAEEASGGFTRHHLLSTLRQAYGHALADEEQQREHKRECPAAVAAPSTAQWSAAPAAQQQLILVGMQRMQQGHWVLILVS